MFARDRRLSFLDALAERLLRLGQLQPGMEQHEFMGGKPIALGQFVMPPELRPGGGRRPTRSTVNPVTANMIAAASASPSKSRLTQNQTVADRALARDFPAYHAS